MINIVLYQPEIPQNAGNIIRLCANTGAKLHFIKPLGFRLNDKQLRRSGLDYIDHTLIHQYDDFSNFIESLNADQRIIIISTKSTTIYSNYRFKSNDCLLFGQESSGLPSSIHQHPRVYQSLRIPMQSESRSINLSNSVAILSYEALRQQSFSNLS